MEDHELRSFLYLDKHGREYPYALEGDWWRREVLAGRARILATFSGFAPASAPHVGIFNPSDSGVIAEILSVSLSATGVEGDVGIAFRSTLNGVYSHNAINAQTGGPGGQTRIHTLVAPVADTITPFLFVVPCRTTVLTTVPFSIGILYPGYGLWSWGGVSGGGFYFNAALSERPLTVQGVLPL